ncbi:MAG: hypothetical protein EOM02_10950 [Synergistales bacterium]|nr:hypothetical protein [Synergistales bacterium]
MSTATMLVVDQSLAGEIKAMRSEIAELRQLLADSRPRNNPWLTAKDFCSEYSLSKSTLVRRMKETPCPIEVLDPEEKIKKYRWVRR